MEDNYDSLELDNFVIKDKEFYASRRKKAFIIAGLVLLALIVIAGIVIVILVIIKALREKGGVITCFFSTSEEDEIIPIINIDDDIGYKLIIDDESCDKSTRHKFAQPGLHNVTFHFKKKLNSLDNFFKNMRNLKEADFSKLEAENIESMANLFENCVNLTKVTFDNKTPKLKNLNNMFYNCINLTNLNLSNFYFESLVSSERMFDSCTALKEIIFNNETRTNNLKDMSYMFSHCKSLEYIDTEIFNVDKVTDLNFTFHFCESLREIDLSHFETNNLESMKGTFANCYELEKIDISYFNTTKVKTISYIFSNCVKLTSVLVLNIDTRQLIDARYAFNNCTSLSQLDLSLQDFSSVKYLDGMFLDCLSLEDLALPNKLVSLESTNFMFEKCEKLTSIDLGFLENASPWKNAVRMFYDCSSLNKIEIPPVNTNSPMNMNQMFGRCSDLSNITLNGLNGDISDMYQMFAFCNNLNYLDVYNLNTKNADNKNDIFEGLNDEKININYDPEITNSIIESKAITREFVDFG